MATLDDTLANMSVKHDRLHDIIDIAPQTYVTGPTHSVCVWQIDSLVMGWGWGWGRDRTKDRSERATNELVLDNRTRTVLLKLMNRGVIGSLHGCVSTGKEANVYFADAPTEATINADAALSVGTTAAAVAAEMQARFPGGLAVKVFKTSILVFKDRDRYVTGEFRFRRGYAKHNPRKMVRLWAEKELRNLHRMQLAGLPVPAPVAVKANVLVMEFMGADGWPSKRLKDVEGLGVAEWDALYVQCVKAMRRMFHVCRLVHADLSEFNMLYHAGRLYIIDVSQSVEHDHPCALEFLRMDCTNVTDFFASKRCAGGLHTMGKVALFNFVVRPGVPDADLDALIDAARREHSALLAAELDPARRESREAQEWKVAEAAFLHSFIPRTLMDVTDCERDIFSPQDAPPMLYSTVTGLADTVPGVPAGAGAAAEPLCLDSDSDDDDGGEDDEKEDDDGEDDEEEEKDEGAKEEGADGAGAPVDPAAAAAAALDEKQKKKLARKAHKKEVKLERRERRKEKSERKKKEKEKRKVVNKQHSKMMGQ